jgi:serine/threonine protein kinase
MSFGRRYHIKRLLGLGGMGAVYQAWDTELGIDVAIKLIRPDIIGEPAAAAEIQRRFKRELLLARLVSHQNVVRIHDLGEIEGLKYITMSYVDGTDLASLLAREGRLPVKRRAAAGAADLRGPGGGARRGRGAPRPQAGERDGGLGRRGADHRLRHRPSPRLARGGWGSALALPSPSPLDLHHANVTQAGSMVGTLEYMPPEQARGEQVDQRADVYALGLMLHDMLSGRIRQTRSPSALDELRSRGDRPPAPLHGEIPAVSEALDQIIARCTDPFTVEALQELGRARRGAGPAG